MRIGNKRIPKAYWLANHQCRPGADMFRYEKDRRLAAELFRTISRKNNLRVINYAIVSGRFMILTEGNTEKTRKVVHDVAGAVAQLYAQKKQSSGPFWKRWSRMCLVQEGDPLQIASAYIDANAAQSVKTHDPAEAKQAGFRELIGIAQRYRIIDRQHAGNALRYESPAQMFSQYLVDSKQWRAQIEMDILSKATAIGDDEFVQNIAATQPVRFVEIHEVDSSIKALTLPRKTAFRLTRAVR